MADTCMAFRLYLCTLTDYITLNTDSTCANKLVLSVRSSDKEFFVPGTSGSSSLLSTMNHIL